MGSTSQAKQGSKIETMNSAIEKMERDMISLQNRSMVTVPGQAEKISASVQKELESSEKKITARVKEEIRISVQESATQVDKISTSVQKELGNLENKITTQIKKEIRISVQEGIENIRSSQHPAP